MKKRHNRHGVLRFNDEVIHLTMIIKGKVILLLFTPSVIPWPIIFLRFATHKGNVLTGMHPLPWNYKRNYKIKYKNILWTALCFSFAGHKHFCSYIRRCTTVPCLPVCLLPLDRVLGTAALICSCLCSQRSPGRRTEQAVNVGWISLLNAVMLRD